MPAFLDCPTTECWQALFSGTCPRDLSERYERHLESCPACQERLDRAEETAGDELQSLGRQVGDPTAVPTEPALARVLERLRVAKSPIQAAPPETPNLYFLQPTDRPGLLGLLGDYEVQEVIGQGGFGIVLKAYEPALRRLVAIKVLAPALAGSATARRRFSREAEAAAAVCHDHVVAVHRVHESDGLPYLVMQYIAGESLQSRLDRTGPLELPEVVRIGMQTAAGLAAAHAQGLIHRDVKPANLLLENGLARVKITDFGLARMADDVQLTQSGVVAGTPEYMAPEQARGEAIDYRADLFSLGSVLYAMCTGVPPFRAASTVAVLRRVSDDEPRPIRSLNPEVPTWMETLISHLLAKDPARRFQSAAEVAALLEGYLAHLQQPTTSPAPLLPRLTAADRPVELSRRLPLFGLAAALVLLVSLGLFRWLPAANDAPAANASPQEFYADFRGGKLPPAAMNWSGRDGDEVIEPEEKGLRIRLPANPQHMQHKFPVGLALQTPVKGNFEITVGYEILGEDLPRSGTGVGFELYLTAATPGNDAICFTRLTPPQGRETYVCGRNTTVNGKRKFMLNQFPTTAAVGDAAALAANLWASVAQSQAQPCMGAGPAAHLLGAAQAVITAPTTRASRSGRLRLTRQGTQVTFWTAEGEEAEFRKLGVSELGTDDLNLVRMSAYPGQKAEAVDVRLVDVRVRSDAPLDMAAAGEEPAGGMKKGIALIAFLGIAGAVAVGAWFLWARRSGRNEREPATPTGKEARPAAPASVVSFACPDCRASVKARGDQAGKKGKCPQCGKAILIPATDALRARRQTS
jgi:serine/threonine protein kinase